MPRTWEKVDAPRIWTTSQTGPCTTRRKLRHAAACGIQEPRHWSQPQGAGRLYAPPRWSQPQGRSRRSNAPVGGFRWTVPKAIGRNAPPEAIGRFLPPRYSPLAGIGRIAPPRFRPAEDVR